MNNGQTLYAEIYFSPITDLLHRATTMKSAKAIWQRTLGLLKFQLTGSDDKSFLASAQAIEIESEVLIVEVPTPLARVWLEGRLLELIQHTLSRLAPTLQGVRFVVSRSHIARCPNCRQPLKYVAPLVDTPQGPGSWWECGYDTCRMHRRLFEVPDGFFEEIGGSQTWEVFNEADEQDV